MNAFFKSAGSVLRRVWVWSLLLVLLSAALVWWFGPLLAVDDYRFWQGVSARWVTISSLLQLRVIAIVMVGVLRGAQAHRPENPRSEHQNPENQARHVQQRVDAERRQVRGRFKEVV